MDDEKAIARLKAGDIGGLEALVRHYQIQATHTAFLITRDRALAEDVVQEAFVRVYERIDQFDDERPFGPWFLRIVANDAVKAARHRQRTVPLQPDEPGAPSWLDHLPDDSPSPESLVEKAETSEQLWSLLADLPPEQRRVIVLRYYVGLKNVEIAEALDLPPGTVRWRLHSARKRLRKLVKRAGWPMAQKAIQADSKEALR
ncbi:MAG: RNA polymerase sigma factor [Ardenticatenaceae bacterium]